MSTIKQEKNMEIDIENPAEVTEFSSIQFEKFLTNLRDRQDAINKSCKWCLVNRAHYKKIVSSWLNVLKRVKFEQRLTLFYLANDVVQYSKRRNYEFLETFGTAIQKGTTLVRDEKIKNKIIRIFQIWQQRGVYSEEFIADLFGLLNIQPAGPRTDEPHEFQANYVINKVKTCSTLEKDTDTKLKALKEHNPKIKISEGLINSLKGKDRAHVDDVEKEVEVYVEHLESYINALKSEIKHRISLISALRLADTQLEKDRRDVKVVANAYRSYAACVKIYQTKLEEHVKTLPSPVPSPDINAPSPGPEEDLDLPEESAVTFDSTVIQFSNPGYYVPPPTTSTVNNAKYSSTYTNANSFDTSTNSNADTSTSFLSNGFNSFLGQNLSFDVGNISTTGLFPNIEESASVNNSYTNNISQPPPPPPPVQPVIVDLTGDVENPPAASYNPLLPPPMPPFSKNNESGFSFNNSMDLSTSSAYDPAYPSYSENYSTDTGNTEYKYDSYNPNSEAYDPMVASDTWDDLNQPWNKGKDIDTPESPPMFEKEGYADPVTYHDSSLTSSAVDMERVIPGLGDLDIIPEDSLSSLGGKDVDHRNLISLTCSPPVNGGSSSSNNESTRSNLKLITTQDTTWEKLDQDYRVPPPIKLPNKDQDYRLPFNVDPPPPPPPPPPKSPAKRKPPPPPPLPAPGTPGDPRLRYAGSKKNDTNSSEIDMDLSEDLEAAVGLLQAESQLTLEPPPPLPDLLDDVGANQFLDEISNELNDFGALSPTFNVANENSNSQASDENASTNWHPLMPPPTFGPLSPVMMSPMGGFIPNRMGPLLPLPAMNGPLPFPQAPLWMGNSEIATNLPNDENPYLNNDDDDELDFSQQQQQQPFPGNYPNNRGSMMNNNFRGNGGFRSRGRGRGGWNRGGMRGQRGANTSPYQRRGKFRGKFNRGGF